MELFEAVLLAIGALVGGAILLGIVVALIVE